MESSDTPPSGTAGTAENRHAYHQEYDRDTAHLGAEVAEAIAAAAGVDATELDRPLWDVVEVDALESLFRNGQSGAVTFGYGVYRVRIERPRTGPGRITVTSAALGPD